MESKIKKSKVPIILGIMNCFFWFFPLIGIFSSIIGISISLKKIKEFKCKEYKIALNLNIIGLILTLIYCIINFIILYIQYNQLVS